MRLTVEELRQISLVHLLSGLDEDNPALLQEGAIFSEITGYTEWVSTTSPAISIGWDWMLQSSQAGAVYYKRVSDQEVTSCWLTRNNVTLDLPKLPH